MDGASGQWALLDQDTALLPIPVRTILLTAIHGWAQQAGIAESGIPSLPPRRAYLPVFIRLLHRPDWQQAMLELVQHGLQHDPAGNDLAGCVKRAFDRPATHLKLVDELAKQAA